LPLNAAINQLTDVKLKLVRAQVGAADRSPNLLRALHSFLAILAPHVIPEAYRIFRSRAPTREETA